MPRGFSRGALAPAAGCPCADLCLHCSFSLCEQGLRAAHAFQPLQLRKSFPLDWGPKLG